MGSLLFSFFQGRTGSFSYLSYTPDLVSMNPRKLENQSYSSYGGNRLASRSQARILLEGEVGPGSRVFGTDKVESDLVGNFEGESGSLQVLTPSHPKK